MWFGVGVGLDNGSCTLWVACEVIDLAKRIIKLDVSLMKVVIVNPVSLPSFLSLGL